MKLFIKSLSLTNFKGIKSMNIAFNHITNIFGENAAGKTTIFDAFTWLFFGKDSTDRKDFELKPLDAAGNAIQKVDVEVSAVIEVDGKAIEIKKVLREKWVKKRGELITEFAGNENLFYWNDVPLQLKQFQDKIGDLLNENIFKLITNPLYFNGLKWQDRRSVLLQIAGNISNDELIAANPDFKSLIVLLGDKTLEEYKREVAARKKKLKDDLQAIPTRIDEINRQMPEEKDFQAMRDVLAEKLEILNGIDEALQNANKLIESAFTEKRNQQTELHELKTKGANLKNTIRDKFLTAHNNRKNIITNLSREVSNIDIDINYKNKSIQDIENEITNLNTQRAAVGVEWENVNKEVLVFGDDQFNCPSCKQALPADQVANSKTTLTENFNTKKASRLQFLVETGTGLKNKIVAKQQSVVDLKAEVVALQEQKQIVQTDLDNNTTEHNRITADSEREFNLELARNAEYQSLLTSEQELTTKVDAPISETDNSELKNKKAAINIEMDAIKKQLTDEDRIKQSKERIEHLQAEEQQLAQQLADLEGSEYLAEQFTKARMDTMVQRINGRFKYVTFKMFDTQINGGEVECCDTLVNGVPFTDANNAAKINAGIDIINTLCEHYGTYAPIFIDNRESVNNLIDCNSQVVNLIVSTDKKLRVA